MNGYRKNTWLAVLVLALGLAAFPFSYSEAQSAKLSLSALECDKLSHLVLENMNVKQRQFARECDMVEASHDWEQQYGGLNEQEFVSGVVYE